VKTYLDKIIEFQGFIKFQKSNIRALFWTEVWMHKSFFNMPNLKIYTFQNQYEKKIIWISKVEKILKYSLDLIPSPSLSVKIQIMSGKVCLRCRGKTWLGLWCQQSFEKKKFVDITQQCFALLPQVNFPANNLNFHWRWKWWDQIQAIFF
jgi:hypothetical protein